MVGSKSIQVFRSASIKRHLIVSIFVLLILALGFNAILTVSSLEKLYTRSMVSKYQVIGKDLQRKLEKSLSFGKPIEKFYGMNQVLEEVKANMTGKAAGSGSEPAVQESPKSASPFAVTVSVALPNGSILYSTEETLQGSTLPKPVESICRAATAGGSGSEAEPCYVKFKRNYYLSLPVLDREKQPAASIVMSFDEAQINALLNALHRRNLIIISAILVSTTLLLVLSLHFVLRGFTNARRLPKLKIWIVLFIVIGSAQILFSALNLKSFEDYYLRITNEKTRTLATLIKTDIDYILSKGVPIQKLVKMEVLLGEVIDASPELNDIGIFDKDNTILYMGTRKGVFDFQKLSEPEREAASKQLPAPDPEYSLRLDLVKDGAVEGTLATNISKDFVFGRLREIALDSLTVLTISLFFFVEMMILIFLFVERRLAGTEKRVHYGIIRPAGFLFLFGIDISISMMPLYMEKLYRPIFGLSKDIVLGLPISVEMLFAGVAVVVAAGWLDRRGWHEPFFCSLVLGTLGMFYSWMAPDALQFILSRGVVGLGFGLFIMAAQGFLFVHTDGSSKAQGLAQLFAGIFAGSICGAAVGAMLAERIGYKPVFLIGTVLSLVVMLYALIFMREGIARPERSPETHPQGAAAARGTRQVVRFLTDRSVLGLILFASLPSSMAFVGFLYYFSPVYLNRIGASQSNIGRVYMIYGVCLIYIAPVVSKYIDAARSKKQYVILSGLLGSLAFTTFYFFGGLAATATTILLLGLSGSFDASRAYALKLTATRELGEGKAMGIYSSISRAGQVLGPLAFGWVILITGMDRGIIYLGLAYVACTLLFFLFAQSDGKGA